MAHAVSVNIKHDVRLDFDKEKFETAYFKTLADPRSRKLHINGRFHGLVAVVEYTSGQNIKAIESRLAKTMDIANK